MGLAGRRFYSTMSGLGARSVGVLDKAEFVFHTGPHDAARNGFRLYLDMKNVRLKINGNR